MSKGGGKGHTPREAKDDLKSTQQLSVIDALSEGPIVGPVNGLQSVLINNTPVVDADGNSNIHGVTVVYQVGETPQAPLEGFEASGAETVLGVEVKHDNPVTRTVVSENVDRLRFTFGVQMLQETTDKGDRNPSSVKLLIQFQRSGIWNTEFDITINGKITTQYLASVVADNLPPRPFSVRMVRVTPDSTTDRLQNKTLWSSYTEIIDIRQGYPGTAVAGLLVDAEQFGSQQVTRNYHLRGRIFQVPSNYDPDTRTYTGLWDGTFKPAYTNNPAWCTMDKLTHPRYGLGRRIGVADVDKWALYAIAQYCDQQVPDGFGGTEPRMTLNAYITTQRKAYDVLADFCSVMRCMPVWNGRRMTFIQDRPSDKAWTYTNGNVVGGRFKYSFSALKDRHNAIEVRYTDPLNGWQTSTELVEDHASQARYGRNLLKMDAFGCTSRGQAHRTGLWVMIKDGLKPLHDAWFYVRSVNLAGKSVFAEVSGRPSDDAKGYLDFFKGLITEAYLGTELLKKIDLTEDNASKLQQFSREWQDANDKWNAMWGVKIEQTKDGKYYVAGLGLSMEDTPDGKISQFLVAADRIAYINPANGNQTPGFVMQDDQIIMNEAFLKYLSAPTITSGGNPPAFSLTP
ncbi:TPA: DUF1983 domain-containing protein, partial [Salmonella enterica subsp. enterica serovar Napoli]|nr:DUF1983 domain-containing protein [Salmonella enterica subsp. enterica serovar Napoli]